MRDNTTRSTRASDRSGLSAVASTIVDRAVSTLTLARSTLSSGLPDLCASSMLAECALAQTV